LHFAEWPGTRSRPGIREVTCGNIVDHLFGYRGPGSTPDNRGGRPGRSRTAISAQNDLVWMGQMMGAERLAAAQIGGSACCRCAAMPRRRASSGGAVIGGGFWPLMHLECGAHVELPVHALLPWPEVAGGLRHGDYLGPVDLVGVPAGHDGRRSFAKDVLEPIGAAPRTAGRSRTCPRAGPR
jgi:hypothetical protein